MKVPIKVIPAKGNGRAVAVGVIVWPAEMILADERAGVTGVRQNLRRGHIVRRDLRVGQIVIQDRGVDAGAQWKATGEEATPARGTFRHHPGVVKRNSVPDERVNVRRGDWIAASRIEGGQLINAHIVHDDVKNVRRRSAGGCRLRGGKRSFGERRGCRGGRR